MYASKIIYTDKDGKTRELYYPIVLNPVYDERFEFIYLGYDKYAVKAKGSLKGDVVVPSFYRDGEVTKIGNYAFFEFNSKITGVELPSSIEIIGDNAFDNCTRLVGIKIPDGVTSIGEWAFHKCESITDIVIPKTVESIGNFAFSGCSSLVTANLSGCNIKFKVYKTDVNTGNTTTYTYEGVGTGWFENCIRLENISMPENSTAIGENAFHHCISLTEIDIPSGVYSILKQAFSMCHYLEKVNLPSDLNIIGDLAFQNCYSLTNLELPSLLRSIGWGAFFGCRNLTITEGNGYFSIVNGCLVENSTGRVIFANNNANVPSGTSAIDGGAFSGKTFSAPVKIPLSVNEIHSLAFQECENLVLHVEAESKPEKWADDWCDDSVTVIWGYKEEGDTCNHEYGGWTTTVLPTCTRFGSMERTCSVCGEVDVALIEPLGHDWVDATCTTPKTCSRCGEIIGEPLGHNWSDWVIDARATGLTEGSKHRECTRCGEIIETTIPKLENADEYLTYTLLDSGEEYSVKPTYLDYLPSELTIPSTFNGKPVVVVEFEAFANHRESPDIIVPITKVILPDSIKAILPGAFDGCTRLTEINIPIGVEYVGEDAFRDCDNLTIYCDAHRKPDAWDGYWNSSNCNVVWDYRCMNGHNFVDGICTKCGYTDTMEVWYGVSTVPAVYDNTFITTLENQVSAKSHLGSITIRPLANEYIYYCTPVSFGECAFMYNNFIGGFSLITTINFTNSNGQTEAYNIYKSNQANLGVNGAIKITIEGTG